jgi:hypothetical protein
MITADDEKFSLCERIEYLFLRMKGKRIKTIIKKAEIIESKRAKLTCFNASGKFEKRSSINLTNNRKEFIINLNLNIMINAETKKIKCHILTFPGISSIYLL